MLYSIAVLIVLLDQGTKYMAIKHLKGKGPYILIENLLQFCYVENRGAAFGILQYKRFLFLTITIIVIIGIIFFLTKNSQTNSLLLNIGLMMLMGGAVGNLIDRIRFGYVVDFISVKFGNVYDFPVFNIADIFIVIGTFTMMLLIIFNRHEC